jgi:hypothetical protein
MLLLRTDALPKNADHWEYQLKLDGYRAIVGANTFDALAFGSTRAVAFVRWPNAQRIYSKSCASDIVLAIS